MKVLVTGATGFTGSHVVPLLLEQGVVVRCLVREDSQVASLPKERVELATGDLNIPASLERALEGVDALVNIASLGFGHASTLVSAAVAAGVKRAIFMSTTAVFTTLNAPSKSVRLAAEEMISGSPLDYTILRPTMIYGTSRDRNMCRLVRYLRQWSVIPIVGSGQHMQQPVYVGDVAAAVTQSLVSACAIGKAYNIAGGSVLTYNQVIDTICDLLKRKVRKLHLPVAPIVSTLKIVGVLPLRLPVKAEQVMRLNEHKAFDFSEAARDLGYRPRSFPEGIRLELEEMGLR